MSKNHYRLSVSAYLALALFSLSPWFAIRAEDLPSSSAVEEVTGAPTVQTERPLTVPTLHGVWAQLEGALERGQLDLVSDQVAQLVLLRDASGSTDLPEYAARLIDRAEQESLQNRQEVARLFYRWGYRLAPNSPEIIWRIVPISSRFGIESPLYLAGKALTASLNSPVRLLIGIQRSISPLLWAFAWATFLALVVVIGSQLMNIFRVLAWYIPVQRRGWGIPILFLLAFGTPLLFGMLWCLTCWAILLYILLPERRFFTLLTGLVVLSCGVLVPVSENIATWLNEPAVHRVVLAGEQPLVEGEIDQLLKKMSDWSGDSVVQLKLAQLLRRAGLGAHAAQVLDRLEAEQGPEGWIDAERGVLSFISGDIVAAERLLRKGLESEGESPEILFNLSRVVFEQNNTRESRELVGRALRKGRGRIESYRRREEILGNRDPRSFADVDLPIRTYFSAALVPNSFSFEQAQRLTTRWMPGMEPRLVALVGLLLVLMHLIPHQRARRIHPRGLFDRHEPGVVTGLVVNMIPAGAVIAGGRARLGFAILCLVVLLTMPLVSGAYREGEALETLAWFMPYHICALMLLYLVMTLFSLNRSEE